ncbi:hypothetical protein QTP86_003143 [Hemibagrus guttatus]|nr:hypothetical protein QTP86_003143 [Hemibagrus guttatus]
MVDRFSKGCKLIPLKGSPTAMQTAEAMFQHVFRNFGLLEDIVSDRGPQFTSRVWGSLCEQLGIGVSSGYHSQSNGQAERLNQEIGRFLRSYYSREQQCWSEFLPWAEYAQNSLIHSSTDLTPFQCVLGYQPPLFPWSGELSGVPAVEEWSCLSQEVCELALVRLQRVVGRQRIQANRRRCPHPPYRVDQRVWLSTRNLRLKLPCLKISTKFVGPFEIVRQPAHPPGIGDMDCIEPPPPLDIEGSPAYQVHALLDSRWVLMADPEAEARARLEDGILEAPLTSGGESGVTHEQVAETKQMENAQLEVVSIGDQDLLASTPSLESHNESITAENSNNNPGSESIEQTGCQTEATNNVQAQGPNPGMHVTKVQPFLSVGLSCRGKFRCSSSLCVSISAQCDGHVDCEHGEDELSCVRVSGKSSVLQVLSGGVWSTVCSEKWDYNLGFSACKQLGYSSFAYPPLWSVLVGLTEQPATGAKYLTVEKIIYHGRYRPKGLDYDIALLKLSQPLTFNGYIEPICLPNFGEEFEDGKICWISGWGATEDGA